MDSERVETALYLFSEGSNCAQAVLGAFALEVGLDSGEAIRLSAGLGAGFGRKQCLCGAVSGGAVILSCRYGSTDPFDGAAKEKAYAAVNQFITAMEDTLGSVNCREILGVSISTPEERQAAKQQGLFDTVCANCVRQAALYLEETLGE